MGTQIKIKQDNFSHGMQSETRNNKLVGQSQVFGAEKIKHFDIYQDGKLRPETSFERFNTDDEVEFGIVAVGGSINKTLYGLGKAPTNWYNRDWTYRIELTANYTADNIGYLAIDLSYLSTDFWDNINADGSDIRVETVSGASQNNFVNLSSFDYATKKGIITTNISSAEDVYIYFGNPDATSEYQEKDDLFNSNIFSAYKLDGTVIDSKGKRDLTDSGTPAYSTGRIGQSLTNCSVAGATGVSVGVETHIGMYIKVDSTIAETDIAAFSGDVIFTILASGLLQVDIKTNDILTPLLTSTTVMTDGVWRQATVNYTRNDVAVLYIDGIAESTVATPDKDIQNDSLQTFIKPTLSTVHIDMVTISQNSFGASTSIAEGKMLTSGMWTEGTLTNYSSITPTYAGIGIYTKEIDETSWKLLAKDKNTTNYPVPSFIETDGASIFYLTSSSSNILNGTIYGGIAFYQGNIITVNKKNLGFTASTGSSVLPVLTEAFDRQYYLTRAGGLDNYTNSTFTASVYDSFPDPTSTVNYGYSLAIGGTRRSMASIELWNLVDADPETRINLGTGKLKIISNINGGLYSVIDNYIQSEELSKGKPSLDIRKWNGQDNISTVQSFMFDNNATVYSNLYDYAISNKRSDLNNSSVFYAEPQATWKGMWALGTNSQDGTFGVSIQYDTEDLGRVTNSHSIGNNLIVITDDNKIYKLSNDTYTQTSCFDSMIIDGAYTGVKKTLYGFEIVLNKDLPVGQVVTLSYSTDGDSFIEVGVCTDKITEFTLAGGDSFNDFNELQVRIESTGGDASIVEYSALVEYQSELL